MNTNSTPWTYTKGAHKNSFVISEKNEVLADNICIVNSSRHDAERNAKIIAAAPDLLSVLQSFVDYLDSDLTEGEAILKAQAMEVIKRATI